MAMTPRVLATVLGLLSLTACSGHVYGGRYYYGRPYYAGGVYVTRPHVVYTAPVYVAPPPRVVVHEAAPAGNAVSGSDGSYGWRVPSAAPASDLALTSEAFARSGCAVEESLETETRAQCGGVEVLARIDATDIYKVCANGTDHAACAATWSRIR